MRALSASGVALGGLLLARGACAQVATDCRLPGVASVPLVADASVGPGAEPGRTANGAPVILHDPVWWGHATRTMRRFAVLHACAHLVMRHGVRPTTAEEQAADCRALAGLRSEGLDARELAALREEMARSLGAARGALLSGEQRASTLGLVCANRIAPVATSEGAPAEGRASPAATESTSAGPNPTEIYRTPGGERGPISTGNVPVFRMDRPTGYPSVADAPPPPVNRFSPPMVFVPVGRGFLIRPQPTR